MSGLFQTPKRFVFVEKDVRRGTRNEDYGEEIRRDGIEEVSIESDRRSFALLSAPLISLHFGCITSVFVVQSKCKR